MRIAFVGKGGSGKTSLSALFVRRMAEKGRTVLAIDADINQHLGKSLGLTDQETNNLPPIGKNLWAVRSHLVGNNTKIKPDATFRMTTPPGTGSRQVKLADSPLLEKFTTEIGGIKLMTVGPMESEDIGMVCYHGKTMTAEIILHHLADRSEEIVAVDMTAGADAFSTSIFLAFDLMVLAVEPTWKSLEVFKQYVEPAKQHGIRIAAVGNRADTPEDIAWLEENLGDALLGHVPTLPGLRAQERGAGPMALADLPDAAVTALEKIHAAASAQKRDWRTYHSKLCNLHAKHADSWLDKRFNINFRDQIDPDFDAEKFYAS